jgi:hypothetical protein
MILPLLFAVALFMSATLLFWIQPLVGKMLLPVLGGAPSVWNSCMLFYQCMLLLGYGYALVAVRRLSLRTQAVTQLVLILLAALLLPIGFSVARIESLPGYRHPVLGLLGILLFTIGLPFFILSTNGPLLQSWFSRTRHASAKDPYFLYAASNLGSFIALLAFPFLLEPRLSLTIQSRFWAYGYAAMALVIAACAIAAWKSGSFSGRDSGMGQEPREDSPDETLTWRRRLGWLGLAFVPSSLMLGATLYISTNIAAAPLLWVVPLAVYLLTFVLAFARTQTPMFQPIARMFPATALILTFVYLSGAAEPVWFLVPLHVVFFFMAAMICHSRLACNRPHARHLVEYYFWIGVGGMAGGLFNAVLAPAAFNAVLEYPIAMVLACLVFRPAVWSAERSKPRWLDAAFPAVIFIVTMILALVIRPAAMSHVEKLAVIVGIPMMAGYMFRHQPLRLGLAVAAIMLGSAFYPGTAPRSLHVERSFFGVLRVTTDAAGRQHQLYHGDTIHGKQFTDPARRCEPLAYYHRRGPLGDVFETFSTRTPSHRFAVIGLGAGAMVMYAKVGQEWTFYEINPEILGIAQNPEFFTYLNGCAPVPVRTVLGDARIKLQEAPEAYYGMLVLDAFSSDAIPIHLITREAIQLYLSRLAPGGMLVFHISNRSLDLSRVLAGVVARESLSGYVSDARERDAASGLDPSCWAVIARSEADLGGLATNPRWTSLKAQPQPVVWTDDFSNLLHVVKW